MNKHLLLLLLLAAPAVARSVKVARLDQSLEPITSVPSSSANYTPALYDGTGIYFNRSDHAYGTEWWYTNGTPSGTRLVANLYDNNHDWGDTTAIMRNGALLTSRWDQNTNFFKLTGGTTVETLPQPGPAEWGIGQIIGANNNGIFYLQRRMSDGGYTEERCFFRADAAASPVEIFQYDDDEDIYWVNSSGRLFYSSGYGEDRAWRASDGTAAGTYRLPVPWDENLNWLSGGFSLDWNGFTWFVTARWEFDTETGTYAPNASLWRSDGTASGTVLAVALGSRHVHSLFPLGSELFCFVQTGSAFQLLRVAAPLPLVPVVLMPAVSVTDPTWKYLGQAGGRAVLAHTGGPSIWTTDGTQAGTQQLVTLPYFPSGSPPLPDSVEFNGYVYIWSYLDGTTRLSRTNGTSWELLQTYSLITNRAGYYFQTQVAGPYLYYTAIYEDEVWLWRTDGTAAGTIRLIEFTERPQTELNNLQRSPQRFAFGSNFGPAHFSDGSPAGTTTAQVTQQRYLLPRYNSTDGHFAATQQSILEPAWSLLKWWPDGSTQTIATSADWMAGANAFYSPRDYSDTPHPLTLIPTGLHAGGIEPNALDHPRTHALGTSSFVARTGSRDIFIYYTEWPGNLWSSDGTVAGSYALPNSTITEYWRLRILPADGDSFVITTGEGRTRWCDGVNLPPLTAGENCPNATVLGNTLFFTRYAAATGMELWKWTRGSSPALVKDIRPGAASSGPGNLRALKGKLWFSCNDGVHGYEPWVSDGTAAGTVMVADCHTGAGHSGPADFAEAGDCICFVADNGTDGRELWQSRGTAATTMMTDTTPGAPSRLPFALEPWGDSVIFLDHDIISGTPGINVSTFTPDPTPAWKSWAQNTFPSGSSAGPLTFGPRANPDGDAADNFGEYAFGTDPRNGAQAPTLSKLPSLPGCLSVSLKARQDPSLLFHIECSTNLSTWNRWSFRWNGSAWISLSPGLAITPGSASGGIASLSLCVQGVPASRCYLRGGATVE